MSKRRIWLNGDLVPWGDATVHVLSQSLQRGSLVFDVMHCYGGRTILGLREHVERFLRSAELNGMRLGLDAEALSAAIGATVRANPGSEAIKLSAYWPGPSLDVLPVDDAPTVAIAAYTLRDILGPGAPETLALPPARLQVAEPIKTPPRALSPQVKIAAGYTSAAMAKRRAREQGFHDILFLDERGDVAESSTQSFFLVERGIARTAPLAFVLAGVTRRAVLDIARDEGIECKEEPIPRPALDSADEAFLTGTTINVWPVARIDGRDLPSPVPGPVTARLAERFERMIAGKDPVLSPRWMQEI